MQKEIQVHISPDKVQGIYSNLVSITIGHNEVIIDFAESRVVDMSAIEALNKITERYQKVGKTVQLRHLSADCRKLLSKADQLIVVNILEDPSYRVAVDELG
jgi:SulP family sulfate permease